MQESRERQLGRLRLTLLNQVAALKLREAGELQREDDQPAFQLMSWGIKSGVKTLNRRIHWELDRLRLWLHPQEAFDYLRYGLPGGVVAFSADLMRLPPRAAAARLLEALDMRLRSDPRNPFPLG